MARRKRHAPEQIIAMLRAIEVAVAQGRRVVETCREHVISEQTYYRWRAEFGGLKPDQAKRLKELERETQRLCKAVADLTQDKPILQEGGAGKRLSPAPASRRSSSPLASPNAGPAGCLARHARPSVMHPLFRPTRMRSRRPSCGWPVSMAATARADSDHSGSYPAAVKKARLSVGVTLSIASRMASHSSGSVLAAAFLRFALIFENAISMGLKSGL